MGLAGFRLIWRRFAGGEIGQGELMDLGGEEEPSEGGGWWLRIETNLHGMVCYSDFVAEFTYENGKFTIWLIKKWLILGTIDKL